MRRRAVSVLAFMRQVCMHRQVCIVPVNIVALLRLAVSVAELILRRVNALRFADFSNKSECLQCSESSFVIGAVAIGSPL